MFSVIADNLRHKDAATLPEMSDILYSAEELRGCFDISGWLSPCLKGVKYHTRTNTFRCVILFKFVLDTCKKKLSIRLEMKHLWHSNLVHSSVCLSVY